MHGHPHEARLFWNKAVVLISLRWRVHEAIIASTLLYGLESLMLRETHLNRPDTLQPKGLRKRIGATTTYGQSKMGKEKQIQTKGFTAQCAK